MRLSDFDYTLPKELIAQHPLKVRDSARLLVLNRKAHSIEHRTFKDIIYYLQRDDLLVLNDTKVLPSRLIGKRLTGGKVEILLLKQKSNFRFEALIKPSRLRPKEKIILNGNKLQCEITNKNEVTFNTKDIDAIYKLAGLPLPPYIRREPQDLDKIYYQTVYAKQEGAIASPTAGLHFTKDLLKQLATEGINIAYITLHIGYSTFKPVKAEDITKHKMQDEYFEISDNTKKLIDKTQKRKARIFAVGTTSCRALETYASGKAQVYTDLFIYPGYKFKIVDRLLTNFHLPRTTLFMLVCAFAGIKLIKKSYHEAIDKKYRFYSYGDAMLIV